MNSGTAERTNLTQSRKAAKAAERILRAAGAIDISAALRAKKENEPLGVLAALRGILSSYRLTK